MLFAHIENLSITDLLIFESYESTISNLRELEIKNVVTFDQIKQIRKLNISVSDKYINFILKELFLCFPHIEYLIYLSSISSIE